MKLTGNLCVICGHDSAMHCFHAHADGSACCSGCTEGCCAGAQAEAEALLDMDGRRERLRSAMDAWRAGTLQTIDAPTARDRIEARIKCPMCGEPRSGAPEPWCAGKGNHEEEP